MDKLAQVNIMESFFGGNPDHFLSNLGDVSVMAGVLANAAIIIATIILFFYFLFGGIMLIAGAGQNKPETAAKGKKAVTSALIGFLVVFAAYWIVRIIEIAIGVPIVTGIPT